MLRVSAVVLCAALLACCGRAPRRVSIPPVPAAPTAASSTPPAPTTAPETLNPPAPVEPNIPPVGYSETGVASWYGYPFHGRRAADGEIYDMEQLTAAHRTLPFNTMVRVENLSNSKTVEVRITDRGPFVGNRVIDLSHAAAQAIEMIGPGTATVRLTVAGLPPVIEPGIFAVQVAAFQSRENASRHQHSMEAAYGSAKLVLREGDPPLWRVLVGREASIEAAQELAQRIRDEQKVPQAFVVRVDRL